MDDAEYESPSQVQGSLEEWREHVGKMCEGQMLLMLGVTYALSGFLLTPCGFEGGGLHRRRQTCHPDGGAECLHRTSAEMALVERQ